MRDFLVRGGWPRWAVEARGDRCPGWSGSPGGRRAAGGFGPYSCRHGNSETLLEYSPDYAAERASGVMSDCAKLGIELPAVELLDLMPEWSALLD